MLVFFLDNPAIEAARGLVLLAFIGIAGWAVRSIIRIWLPVSSRH